MTDENPTDTVEVGWMVTDPDGNVVESGGVSIAKADGQLAELIEQLRTEGEQE
jgi:hypothetical protein